MPTKEDLRALQALPLWRKIAITQTRILEWYLKHKGKVYVSFSGGKDSTVLLHIARRMYPDIEAVFVDTGLEYPEIRSFVKSFDNVTILRPKMRFDEVIRTYGYPFISKETANCVRGARNGSKSRINRLNGLNCDGSNKKSFFSQGKWKPLLGVDFQISERCCDVMKKAPIHKYEKESGKLSIVATMASESLLREKNWLQNGCNTFSGTHIHSAPMSFWTEQDILQYIKIYQVEFDDALKRANNSRDKKTRIEARKWLKKCNYKRFEIAPVYGEVLYKANNNMLYENTLCDCGGKFCTSGCSRTGCIFCGFGAHLEKGESRFQRLKRTHPRQYEYCMGGGAYDTDGFWKPTKEGLGMAHCIDEINRIYGKDFIKY